MLECEQPHRKTRRGRGKSDPIDAHLAVLSALRLDADRLPTPRADGDREALRILLGARHDLTVTSTAQTNRLRALLRDAAMTPTASSPAAALTDATLARLARRRLPRDASREHAIRHAEIRRLALALRDARRALKDNRAQLQSFVDELVPGLTERRGIGPVTAAQAIVSFSHPGRCRNDAAFAALAGTARYRPAADAPCATASTAAATAPSTAPSTPSPRPECASCPTTQAYIARRTAEGKTSARSGAASSDTSPASSTAP